MKLNFFFFFSYIFPLLAFPQCNEETISYTNGNYIGCVNYEGQKDGKGVFTYNIDTQTQIQEGIFKNDNFISGVFTVKFSSGDNRITTYSNYQTEIIESDIYEWENGDKIETFYSNGEKVKEIETNGPGNLQGLITTKIYNQNSNPIITTNIDNNRYPDDIIGNDDFTEINLIAGDNKFKISIGFIKNDGSIENVPILFDSGAQDLFIGYRLYQELLLNSNITDMNVLITGEGVGSKFETKVIKINEILIGNYRVKNVIATVPLNEEINSSLIGIGFLKKFKEVLWSLNSNLMRFYK